MDLYLVRHAEPVAGNDPPLMNPDGEEQAAKLGEMFARINNNTPASDIRIVTSTLHRAAQTAEIIRGKLHVPAKNTRVPPPTATDVTSGNVERLMTHLRVAASLLGSIPFGPPPKLIIVVWHHPNIGDALNWLVGNNLMHWPDIYGATAHVECSASFGQGTGLLRWFILPELLPPLTGGV